MNTALLETNFNVILLTNTSYSTQDFILFYFICGCQYGKKTENERLE